MINASHVSNKRSTPPTVTIKVKDQRTNTDRIPCHSEVVAVFRENPQRVHSLESLCSRRDHGKGPRDFYILR